MARRPPDGETNVAAGAAAPRSSGGGGRGPAIASGGLNFDTAGLKAFTAAMNTAARSVKDFWAPFKEAEKHQAKVDDFFKNLKRQIADVKKESAGLALPGLGAGRPGGLPVPGGARPAVQNGGDSRFSQARAAFQGGREGQPASTLNMGRLGAGAALAAVTGGLANFADRRLPVAMDAETVATRAAMSTGNWSAQYRDSIARNLSRGLARGGMDTADTIAAGGVAQSLGMPAGGGAAGGPGRNWVRTAGVLGTLTGESQAQSAATSAPLTSGVVSNRLLSLNINTSPGGQQRDPIPIFKELTEKQFGTLKPPRGHVLAAQNPDSTLNLKLRWSLGDDPALFAQYIAWLDSNSATGATITTLEQAQASPMGQALAGRERERGAAVGQAESRLDQPMLAAGKVRAAVATGVADAASVILDKTPLLADALGTAAVGAQTLRDTFGRLNTTLIAFMAGQALTGLGNLGKAAGGASGAVGKLGSAAGVAGAAWLGLQIGKTIYDTGITKPVENWLGEHGPSALGMGDQSTKATKGGKKRTHKGKQIYKGPTRYGVDMKEGGQTSYHEYGQGPFPELRPGGEGVGDPVPGATWNFRNYAEAGDVGDPIAATGELPGKGSKGLNDDFKSKLRAMFSANPKLTLSSGFRDRAQQAYLYDRWKRRVPGQAPAAPPGKSNHEKGLAADIGPRSEYNWLAQNAPRYGLKKPMSYEPWHWEPTNAVGGVTQEAGTAEAAAEKVSSSTAGGSGGSGGGGGGGAGGGINLYGPNFGNEGPQLSASGGFLASGGGSSGGGGGSAAATKGGGGGAAGGGAAGATAAPGGDPKASAADASQDEIMRMILKKGREMGASPKALLAAFETGWVESGMRNLNHGDRDSKGVFQQRPSQGWGSIAQVTNVEYAAEQFFKRAIPTEAKYKTAGQLAQGVQRSAFPERYDQNRGKAAADLARLGVNVEGVGDPVGLSTGTVSMPSAPTSDQSPFTGSRGVVVQNATFTIQIQSASPEDAEKAGREIMSILTNSDRLMEAAET